MEKKGKKFEELGVEEKIVKALSHFGYTNATPIQEQTIPYILEGKDVIGQSQTGTGKTASFGIPTIQKIEETKKAVQAIILCPTRELALQVSEELRRFCYYKENIKCLAIYGGESIERQIKELKKGVKIIIGTPGRIMDHMRRNTLKLDNIQTVILDEADEMLNMGFEEDIETILKQVPEERQTVLFSATMNPHIMKIAGKYLKCPKQVKIKAKELTVDRINQIAIEMKQAMKNEALMRLIDINQPKKAVVFCNTKKKVDDVIEIIKAKGYQAEALHGDIKQIQRDRIMRRFKQGDFPILVATDVVARGIDVDKLELVINYDIPQEEEYYVHRIGRTGRNGNNGKAYTFVVGKEKSKIYKIQKYANTKIQAGKIPTIDEISKIRNKSVIGKIEQIIKKEKYENEKVNKQILEELLKENSIEIVAKALLEMANPRKEEINFNYKTNNNENSKLFLNLGKKDKIMVKDIVGSFSSNVAISGSEIGKINILDKFSFVEVPNEYVNEIIVGMKGKQIKGRDVTIEIANA